jgi:NarL family two-component system sensor histidine kinase YdfH
MQAEKSIFVKVKDLFFPPGRTDIKAVQEVIPFFALVTIALVWMYVIYVRQIEITLTAVIFSLLMLLHLILYWAVFRFIQDTRSLRLYFIFQGLLAFVIVLFVEDFGLAIGLYASLIGNAVGSIRHSRDLLVFIPAFLLLAALAISLQSGMAQIIQWSYVAIPSILLSGFIAFMFRRQLEMRENAERLLADLQKAHVQLEAYAEQVEALTLTEERQRIARELHDTLAQELTGVVLQLEAVSTHIEKDNPQRAQEILQGAMQQSRFTLAEARKVIDNLRSAQSGAESLAEAIRQEAIRFEALAQIRCETSVHIKRTLPGETSDHLLKIASEGLNNIAKHANASQAWVRLSQTASTLRLEIEDDGRGFVPADENSSQGHYGLIGIKERVALLAGRMSIDSHPGEGTCLTIEIPLSSKGADNES